MDIKDGFKNLEAQLQTKADKADVVRLESQLNLKATKSSVETLATAVDRLEKARADDESASSAIQEERNKFETLERQRSQRRRWAIGVGSGVLWTVPWTYIITRIIRGH